MLLQLIYFTLYIQKKYKFFLRFHCSSFFSLFVGAGTSKKEARKAAALNLLLLLEEENGVDMFLKKRKQVCS